MKYILELEDEPNKEYFGEGNYYRCKQIPYWSISESMRNRLEPYDEADRKTEPTISKMEQVDKDINVRSKDEPQNHSGEVTEMVKDEPMKTTDYCDICKRDMCEDCIADATNPYCVPSHYEINYEPKDEPQTDMAEDIVRSYGFKAESYQQAKAKDEPQTERSE